MLLPKNLVARRLREVAKWLEPLHSEVKLQGVRERRQLGTCEWLLSHDLFVSWFESSGSFLWLNGIRESVHFRPMKVS